MRTVAIAIQDGEGLDAAVDPRFGRAARFAIAAADGSAVEVLDNPGVQAAHGAGIGAAALLVRRGVGAVIAGRFGPKASDALAAAGVAMFAAPDGMSARDALAALEQGKLASAEMQRF